LFRIEVGQKGRAPRSHCARGDATRGGLRLFMTEGQVYGHVVDDSFVPKMALGWGNFEGRGAPCRHSPTALAFNYRRKTAIRGRIRVRLKGKVALITGGGRGIGRDIVLAYAREGAHVVVNDIDPVTAAATATEAGGKSIGVAADVAKSADINRLIEATIKEFGRIDIVVNNAMKIVPGKLEALPEAAWDTTMNIGLKGAFLVSQAAANHMIAQKSGCIVNIASIAGLFPYNWAGAYSVVKAGLIMLTKLQAMEWAPYGIRANAITPGYIRTPGTEAMYADPEIYEGRRKGVPMGRVGTGEDIAGPAIFLASDDARYTTGSVVGADGGQAVGYFLSVPGRRFSGGRID
jgi:2-deoxy-D-gluconate 3-dehydrogenase